MSRYRVDRGRRWELWEIVLKVRRRIPKVVVRSRSPWCIALFAGLLCLGLSKALWNKASHWCGLTTHTWCDLFLCTYSQESINLHLRSNADTTLVWLTITPTNNLNPLVVRVQDWPYPQVCIISIITWRFSEHDECSFGDLCAFLATKVVRLPDPSNVCVSWFVSNISETWISPSGALS